MGNERDANAGSHLDFYQLAATMLNVQSRILLDGFTSGVANGAQR